MVQQLGVIILGLNTSGPANFSCMKLSTIGSGNLTGEGFSATFSPPPPPIKQVQLTHLAIPVSTFILLRFKWTFPVSIGGTRILKRVGQILSDGNQRRMECRVGNLLTSREKVHYVTHPLSWVKVPAILVRPYRLCLSTFNMRYSIDTFSLSYHKVCLVLILI